MKLAAVVVALALAGCAGVEVKTTDPATGVTTTTIDLTQGDLAKYAHADELAAAQYAQDHGFPERAAVRRAIDALATAVEQQGSACLNAGKAFLDSIKPSDIKDAKPITKAEILEEAVGGLTGIPARLKTLCAAIPVPPMPKLPGIPKQP